LYTSSFFYYLIVFEKSSSPFSSHSRLKKQDTH
jgi:hypothetical protein